MNKFKIVTIKEIPTRINEVANWFSDKWGVPASIYIKSMKASLNRDKIQEWYICLNDKDEIIAGMGEIENDFHDKKEYSPNICAVYTLKEYRGLGIAGKLLDYVVKDNKRRGISPLYLLTDHTSFYERYGWEFFCLANGDGEDKPSRLYIHR